MMAQVASMPGTTINSTCFPAFSANATILLKSFAISSVNTWSVSRPCSPEPASVTFLTVRTTISIFGGVRLFECLLHVIELIRIPYRHQNVSGTGVYGIVGDFRSGVQAKFFQFRMLCMTLLLIPVLGNLE